MPRALRSLRFVRCSRRLYAHCLAIVCVTPLGAGIAAAQSSSAAPATAAAHAPLAGLDPALRDTTADPCVDFYQYACGGWLRANPVPPDQSSYGRGTELSEQNRLVLRTILERASALGLPRSPEEQKIGDDYATCMDTTSINMRVADELPHKLTRIDAITSKDQLPVLVAEMQSEGLPVLFRFSSEPDFKDAAHVIASFDQPRLGLPERGFYLRSDPRSTEIRKQYQDHIARTFVLLHVPKDQAAAEARTVLALETELATASLSNEQRRDPAHVFHKTERTALVAALPAFSIDAYLRASRTPEFSALNVATPQYFAGLNSMLAAKDLSAIKALLRWDLIHGTPGTALPQNLDGEDFAFYGRTLSGQPEQEARWKRCVRTVDGALGEALGKVYVAQRFSPEDKQRVLAMTRDVETAMRDDLAHLAWMSRATKKRGREKLDGVTNKIGYPDTWRDYIPLQIVRGDALGNAERAAGFERARQLAKIGKPVDKTEWNMTPPTVNAYYHPLMNTVNFPAGILQPPYFDPRMDEAVNFGDAGGIIGHELTHAFDDQGRQFDAQGNYRDWWTPSDEARFNARAQCLVHEYSGFVPVGEMHINGKLTLGENIADLGGLRLAYKAWEADRRGKPAEAPIAGLTPEQQFFVSYAQGWCENTRPEEMRLRLETDPHSPEMYRVNGVVVNLPEFGGAFRCSAAQPMVSKDRCGIW